MIFDLRNNSYIFKHAIDLHPKDNSDQELEHFHTSYEFLYFIHGDAELMIQHRTYKVRPSNLLIIKPGEYHYIEANPAAEYERIVIRFPDSQLPDHYKTSLKKLGTVYNLQNTPIPFFFMQMNKLYDKNSFDNNIFILVNLLNIIIALICNENLQKISAEQKDEELNSIVSFISDHLISINSIDDISTGLHMSNTSLQQKMNYQIHTSVMSYVRTQKCMLAHDLMQQGVPPTSVYLQCGFHDYSTFYRTYKKIYNVSPSDTTDRLK